MEKDRIAQQQGRRADFSHGAQSSRQVAAGRKAQNGDLLRVDVQLVGLLLQVGKGFLCLGQSVGGTPRPQGSSGRCCTAGQRR